MGAGARRGIAGIGRARVFVVAVLGRANGHGDRGVGWRRVAVACRIRCRAIGLNVGALVGFAVGAAVAGTGAVGGREAAAVGRSRWPAGGNARRQCAGKKLQNANIGSRNG